MNSAGRTHPNIKTGAFRTHPISRSLVAVMWAMVTACTVGPTYKPPESPSTTRYLAASESGSAPDPSGYNFAPAEHRRRPESQCRMVEAFQIT